MTTKLSHRYFEVRGEGMTVISSIHIKAEYRADLEEAEDLQSVTLFVSVKAVRAFSITNE